MATSSSDQVSGAKRASDFNNVLHGVPGQVAMLHVINYSARAKNLLSQGEFDELLEASRQAGEILRGAGTPVDCSAKQPWPEAAERINADVKEKYEGFPAITDGFRQFVEYARHAYAANSTEMKY